MSGIVSFKKSQVLQSYLDGKEDEENLVFQMVQEEQGGMFDLVDDLKTMHCLC